MKLDFGYSSTFFRRHWIFFLGIQALIFVKVLAFYSVFGHGISYAGQPLAWDIPFASLPVFGNPVHVLDYFFHQLMHVLIFVWVFLLAKHAKRIDLIPYALLFVAANVLHNVGYWLTASHPSAAYSLFDFGIDYFSLWFFLLFLRVLFHAIPSARRISIPFLESRAGE